ncbi:MAG: recombination regulator RecX [Gammaproteobacteria bacterium]|nr:recombination regulator RecX [Gammaproteobacteria bacterium]
MEFIMEVAQGSIDALAGESRPSSRKSPRSVRRVAMDCLARREHSLFELKRKLQSKFPDKEPAEIQRELERLRDENLQSDKRFVECFVRYRKSRGFGFLAIRESLRSKFVSEGVIEQYLSADDDEWTAILRSIIQRRLPGNRLKFGSKDHLRLVRFLQGRGFSQTQIQQSLSPYISS